MIRQVSEILGSVLKVAGIGGLDSSPPKKYEERDDSTLHVHASRFVPRPIIVDGDNLKMFRERLAKHCVHGGAMGAAGWLCPSCRDQDVVTSLVSRLGRIRVLPSG